MTKQPKITLRYEAAFGHWRLQCVSADSKHHMATLAGAVGGEPDWLKHILTVAKVGGYEMEIPHPPPETIVWFLINPNKELIGFYGGAY